MRNPTWAPQRGTWVVTERDEQVGLADLGLSLAEAKQLTAAQAGWAATRVGQGENSLRRGDAQGHGELPVCRGCHRSPQDRKDCLLSIFPPDRIRELRNHA